MNLCWQVICSDLPIASYVLMAALLVPVDAWCDGVWCGSYVFDPGWYVAQETISPCADWTPQDPGLGQVWMFRLKTLDANGNEIPACAGT